MRSTSALIICSRVGGEWKPQHMPRMGEHGTPPVHHLYAVTLLLKVIPVHPYWLILLCRKTVQASDLDLCSTN